MGAFVRSAAWLRDLFPSSGVPLSTPDYVSDDVALTSPYDGGGYPIVPSEGWLRTVNTVLAAGDQDISILTVGAGNIFRVASISYSMAVFTATLQAVLCVLRSGIRYALSDKLAVSGGGGALFVGSIRTPIVGPNHELILRVEAATLNDQLRYQLIGLEVPKGTVFYL